MFVLSLGLSTPLTVPPLQDRTSPAHHEVRTEQPSGSLRARRLVMAAMGWLMLIGQSLAQPTPLEPEVVLLDSARPAVSLFGRSQYWVDTAGTLDVDAVEQQSATLPLAPYSEQMLFNLDPDAALWIRFEAQVQDNSAFWELELARSGTDRISLYHRGRNQKWQVQEAGDQIAVANWPNPDRFPVFALDQRTDAPVTYWVRIAHARVPFSGELVVHSHSHLRQLRIYQQFMLGGYFGLALLLTAIAVANSLIFKDSTFASYAAYIFLLAASLSASLGIGGQFIWSHSAYWNGLAEFLLLPLAAVAGLMFVRHVVQTNRIALWLDQAALGVALLLLGLVLVDTIAPSKFTLQIMTAVGATTMVMILALIVTSWRTHDRWVRWISLGVLPVLLAGTVPILRNFGLISTGFITQYGMVVAATVEAPLLMFGLLRRFSVRNEARTRARTLDLTEPLTGLSNRYNFLMRLHNSLVRATRYKHQSALLLIDLDNHDSFALEHGREVADRALVLTGSRLRSVARDVDTAARVGNHEFALLMEGPVSPAQAVAAATRIVAAGLRPSVLLPSGASLRFKVVVALLPDPHAEPLPDAQAQLDWMHIELMGIEAERRKTIQTLNF
jgi:two-component system, sensor histidine kinase LadS